MNKKGFTLIELLVVIAIIGILSSVAIVYLSDARKRANDAKVSSNVTTASTQVELDRANDTTIDATAVSGIITKLGAYPCTDTGRTAWSSDNNSDYSAVAYYAELCTTAAADDVVFCADSAGYRGTTTATLAGGTNGSCLQ